jgi:hypothetical protein
MSSLKFYKKVWNELIADVVDSDGVKRMQRVADACNAESGLTDGFRVSTEGEKPLLKHSYRATVIAVTRAAKRHNAKHNTLVKNLYLSGD